MALTDNVVAVYEFNESSGTTAADATGGGKTLVNFNGVAWVAGKMGNCIDLEKGSMQCFQRTDSSFSLGGDLTVSAWINLESYGGGGGDGIALYTTNEAEGNWALVTNGDLPAFYHRPTGGSWGTISGTYAAPTAALPALGTWFHLLFRRSSGTYTVWVNGASKSIGSFTGEGGGWGQQHFAVGQFYPDPTWNYDGLIDQVAIWSRALSDSEIGEIYNSGNGLPYSSWGGGGASLTKSVSDSIALNDFRSGIAGFARSLIDPINENDLLGKTLAYARAFTDPINENDFVAKLLQLTKALSDPINEGDFVSNVILLTRAVTDPISLSDSNQRRVGKLLSDAINKNDLANRIWSYSRLQSDPIVITEVVGRLRTLFKSLADPIVFNESVVPKVNRVSLSDPINLLDSTIVSLSGAKLKSVTDPINLLDNLLTVATLKRSLSDPITLIDFLTTAAVLKRSVSEPPLIIGENLEKAFVKFVNRSDPITLTDSVSATLVEFVPIGPGWIGRDIVLGIPRDVRLSPCKPGFVLSYRQTRLGVPEGAIVDDVTGGLISDVATGGIVVEDDD